MSTQIPDFLLNDTEKPPANPHRHSIECDVEVVTPMFLAGADQQNINTEGLRAASLKGVLRWWWRANQVTTDYESLRILEGNIWGDSESGQGISIRTETIKKTTGHKITSSGGAADYYLGYGVGKTGQGRDEKPARPGIKNDTTDALYRMTASCSTDTQKEALILALQCLHCFGGIGSRSRRTWGSISLSSHDITFLSSKELFKTLQSRKKDGANCDHSVLDSNAQLVTTPFTFPELKDMYESIHQIFKGPDKLHKECWAFGLPHTKGKNAVPDGPSTGLDRRSSPIMLKAHRSKDGYYSITALLTGGQFHEDPRSCPPQSQLKKLQIFMDNIGKIQ